MITTEAVDNPWPPGPARPALGPDDLHVWVASLTPTSDVCLERSGWCLSESEQSEALSRRSIVDRRLYIGAHVFMRDVLARYLGCRPGALQLVSEPGEKPGLLGSRIPLSFNLAHSGSLALLAIAMGSQVGVDVERIREEGEWLLIAEQLFSLQERADLAGLPEAQRLPAFFSCWTCKEALVKATGLGMKIELNRFSVQVGPQVSAPSVTEPAGSSHGLAGYALRIFSPAPGYTAAVAVEGSPRQPVLWSWL